jgi:alpha-L-fucosidase 2
LIPALLLGLSLSPGALQPCPALQVRNPDGNYIVPGVRGDIAYSGNLALDAYVQRPAGSRPSVVVIHGGAWSSGSRVAHVGQLLELLTRAGVHWFSVDYRLGGVARYQDALTDLRAALSFIRCRSAELGIDAGKLVLLGEDSGAHLAALLAAERPAGVIGAALIGGFFDLARVPALASELPGGLVARASPVNHVAARMPPVLVVHGTADADAPVEHARGYCAAITRVRGRCRLVEVAGASHRSENWWPSQWDYKRELTAWLSELAGVAPAEPQEGVIQKDIIFAPDTRLKLDAFVPRSRTPVPAVIVVHGGGWEAGDKVTYVTPLFEPLARAGLAWFSIDYRLTPEVTHDAQLEDVRQALGFIRASHRRFNIDSERIVLLGESASAQMVTLLAAEDPALAGVVSFYGVYDLPSMVTDASPRSLLVRLFRRTQLDDESRKVLRDYSPLYRAHARMPPMLLVNGTGERLWAQGQAYAQRLQSLGIRHEVIALDGAPHGLENWEGRPEWATYKARVIDWIRRVVR